LRPWKPLAAPWYAYGLLLVPVCPARQTTTEHGAVGPAASASSAIEGRLWARFCCSGRRPLARALARVFTGATSRPECDRGC
jgi:hypothetical protein